ncbi:MAG: TIM barrel protein [Balneolaceae bacterium]
MDRKQFLKNSIIAGSAVMTGAGAAVGKAGDLDNRKKKSAQNEFKLKYAPHFGMFRNLAGRDVIDQLNFMAERGFTALEDNGMKGRDIPTQERIAQTMEDLGMQMGVFVAHQIYWSEPNLAGGDPDKLEEFLDDIRGSVEVAQRVNAKWMTVVPGHVDLGLEMDYQTANVVEALRRASEILEPHGLVMVLEPLNHWTNHPGMFLSEIPQAYQICRAVDSPSCKILFDIYHQQITEGNLIPNIDRAWEEVAYFQIGDNPGRNEPGTGEINYRNIFKHIHDKGFDGIMGMEHGNANSGSEGEEAVIEAYIAADNF